MDTIPEHILIDILSRLPDGLVSGPVENVVIAGTFDGVVLLVFERISSNDMILYNPFTRDYKFIPNPPNGYLHYGFGYASTTNQKDLKVVAYRNFCAVTTCHVFSLEEGAWSVSEGLIKEFTLSPNKGATFCNGFLHWSAIMSEEQMFIQVLDMTKMVFTKMGMPGPQMEANVLGSTREGCLSMFYLNTRQVKTDVWVMKEYGVVGSWSKIYSMVDIFIPYCILGNLKMVACLRKEINIYDPEKRTYKRAKVSFNDNRFISCIEYVETLVSPSALWPNF